LLGPVAGSLRDNRRPHIGSGMCNVCFYKEQEKSTKKQTPTEEVGQIFCRYCGAKNELDAVFCKSCGKKIGK
jgi:primosomal protein N'